MARPIPRPRDQYRYFRAIDLRWNDIDRYGHVNNAIFFELFDTTVNAWLAEVGLFQDDLDPMCVVARHACDYFSEIKLSDKVEVALAIEKLGTSSLNYIVALFRIGDDQPAAQGQYVHVAVDRTTRRPSPIGAEAVKICQTLVIAKDLEFE
jgi:acyl-CoA thioester hydrolase